MVNNGENQEEKSCHKCINSKMNGFELICVEWQQVIEDDECLCSCYEEEKQWQNQKEN